MNFGDRTGRFIFKVVVFNEILFLSILCLTTVLLFKSNIKIKSEMQTLLRGNKYTQIESTFISDYNENNA